MRDVLIGRTLRALRHRRGWRQIDLATRAHVSRSVLADLEAGRIGTHALDALRRCTEACGGRLDIDLRVPGGDLSRLLDADHARLQSAWAGFLAAHAWEVSVEVTFNHYGERGSIDILAWHPAERVLLVCEVKTVIVDAQALPRGRRPQGARRRSPRPSAGLACAGRRASAGRPGGVDCAPPAGRARGPVHPLRASRASRNCLDARTCRRGSAERLAPLPQVARCPFWRP